MKKSYWLISAAVLAGAGSAYAQSNPAPQGGIETIVVTAQHRSEDAEKAAVALNAFGEDELRKNDITEPAGLGFLVPALTPSSGGFFMRGVGNFIPNVFADPAIAFNYDGVYVARPLSVSGFFFDLDRIEVLKGPQGTLYGRNATGGAINVVPASPNLDSTSGYVTANYGNYNNYGVEAALNLALDDQTAIRASGSMIGHNAYLSDGTSDEETRSGRFQIFHEFTTALSVTLGADYEYIGGVGNGSSYVDSYKYNAATHAYTAVPAGLGSSIGLFDPASQAFRETLTINPAGHALGALTNYPFQNNNQYGLNAKIDYRTDFGDFVLIPAWRHSSLDEQTTNPGFVGDVINPDQQVSVEGRFQSKEFSIFDVMLGGLYFHENDDASYVINQSSALVYLSSDQITDSYAGFARVTAHLTDALRVVGGLRYTDDNKSFDGLSTTLGLVCPSGACPAMPLFPTEPTLAQLYALGKYPVLPYTPGAVPASGVIHTPPPELETRQDLVNDNSLTNNRITYRAAVEYDVAPTSLAYASVETGFHSGGFGVAAGYLTYQPEYITAYTIGSKNRFFDNTLQVNVEGFIWDYRNQQITHGGIDANGNPSNITQNIGSSTNQGVEADGRWMITDTTMLSADIQYLDANYDSFSYRASLGKAPAAPVPVLTGCSQTASGYVATVNCSGMQAYNSPKWTANFGIEHTFDIDGFQLIPSADTQFRSSRYVGFDYLQSERQASTWQTNVDLTLAPDTNQWSAQLYVLNIEDDRYKTGSNLYALARVVTAATADPRTYGIRLSYRY